jgi:hypothetical protein
MMLSQHKSRAVPSLYLRTLFVVVLVGGFGGPRARQRAFGSMIFGMVHRRAVPVAHAAVLSASPAELEAGWRARCYVGPKTQVCGKPSLNVQSM